MNIIETHHLTKYYRKSRGIEDLNIAIVEGETFGFIGPNGAGKSTTIRTLLNFIFPTSGSALIFNKDIVKHSKAIRQQIGYIPSEIHYYDDMKVVDLLRYSARFYKKSSKFRMKELAARLDLDLGRKIEDLSFGNRKKVGIVQSLLHEPKLLIMDEPTRGLDPLMQNTFFELIQEEKDKGVTVFFSSHILGEVQKLCDRVGIIKDGRLLTIETVDNLTKNKAKKITLILDHPELFNIQSEGILSRETHGNHVKLLYTGDIKPLMLQLNELPYKDLLIEEPSLEEVFMPYYTK